MAETIVLTNAPAGQEIIPNDNLPKTVIAPIVNDALRVAPHSDLTMALIRQNYPTLQFDPESPPDVIRGAIAQLPPTAQPRRARRIPQQRLDSYTVAVNYCRTVYGHARVDTREHFEGDIEVPFSIFEDGEDAVREYVEERASMYAEHGDLEDPYEFEADDWGDTDCWTNTDEAYGEWELNNGEQSNE